MLSVFFRLKLSLVILRKIIRGFYFYDANLNCQGAFFKLCGLKNTLNEEVPFHDTLFMSARILISVSVTFYGCVALHYSCTLTRV